VRRGRRLAAAVLRMVAGPLAEHDRARRVYAEREARDVRGMPWGHPEYLTRPIRRRDERQLDALAAELWPENEWMRELRLWL
jgi:hypothetical protein